MLEFVYLHESIIWLAQIQRNNVDLIIHCVNVVTRHCHVKLVVFSIPERNGVVLKIAFISINLLCLTIFCQLINFVFELVVHRIGSCCLLVHVLTDHVTWSTAFVPVGPVVIRHILLLNLQLLLLLSCHILKHCLLVTTVRSLWSSCCLSASSHDAVLLLLLLLHHHGFIILVVHRLWVRSSRNILLILGITIWLLSALLLLLKCQQHVKLILIHLILLAESLLLLLLKRTDTSLLLTLNCLRGHIGSSHLASSRSCPLLTTSCVLHVFFNLLVVNICVAHKDAKIIIECPRKIII